MSVVANVAINIDTSKALSQLKALEQAVAKLNGALGGIGPKASQSFGAATSAVGRFSAAIQGAGQGIKSLGSSLTSLGGAAATVAAGALVKGFGAAGIEASRTERTIRALSSSYNENGQVQAFAAKAAKEFGLGQTEAAKGVANLYGRLRPMGISLADIQTTFSGVNKAALQVGLSSYDTSEAFTQLAQAMGSGVLQGDELKSLMERMPAIGQAVAKVMGVTVGEIKQLGADGKITTDIMIKAMQELNKIQPPPPDAFRLFDAAMKDLSTSIGIQLLPLMEPLAEKITLVAGKLEQMKAGETLAKALTPLADGLLKLLDAFSKLDPKMQEVIIQITALGIAFGLIVVPIGLVVGAVGNIISAFGGLIALFQGGAIVAAVSAFVQGAIAALGGFLTWVAGTFIPAIVTFFSGPVGWTVLAVAAVVTMCILFQEPIAKFLAWLDNEFRYAMKVLGQLGYDWFLKPWVDLWNNYVKPVVTKAIEAIKIAWNEMVRFWRTNVIDPVGKAWTQLTEFLPKAMETCAKTIKSVFDQVGNAIKGTLNAVLRGVFNAVNGAINNINNLIKQANALSAKVKGPQLPYLPTLDVPQFANGGVVNGPTLAMVGEGGEPEYIIPQSKMAAASANFLNGARGSNVIPGYANGGFVGGNAQINVTTGPVMQQGGQQYVTLVDMEKAMRKTADGIYASLRTPAGRYATGIR